MFDQWSTNAAFIQSLYRPRTPADGYAEIDLVNAERTLGVAFPTILRRFYQFWGRHREMTRSCEQLLELADITVKSGALLFCCENQGVGYWAVPLESLKDDDPPVRYGYAPDSMDVEELGPWVPFYPLSRFMDALTLGHAFACGAPFGGVSLELFDDRRRTLTERHWPRIRIETAPWGLYPDAQEHWNLFGKEGLALDLGFGAEIRAVARSPDVLDEIRRTLDLTWRETWGVVPDSY